MVKDRKPKRLKRLPKLTVVIGKVKGPVEAKKILMMGECARATHPVKSKKIVCVSGCPPSHKMTVLKMMIHYRVLAPLVLPSLIFDGFVLYPIKKIKGWLVNLKFKPLTKK
jgi:cytoskeletal protein CcmA (bactofilin family)